jgi:prophage tail gpP-like protein
MPILPRSKVELRVGAKVFSGWKTANLTRKLDHISGSFSLSVSDRWSVIPRVNFQIREGDEVSILVDKRPLITGFVDARNVEVEAETHSIQVTGRDRVQDAIDSSVDLGVWEYENVTLQPFLLQVLGSFGVSMTLAPGVVLPTTPLDRVSINPGEKGFQLIDRLTRFAGVLPVPDGVGGIVLTQPGSRTAPAAVVEGATEVLRIGGSFRRNERHNAYKVLAQQPGSDRRKGAIANAGFGVANDPDIRATRTLVIQSENAADSAQAIERANWERAVRAARSDTIRATLRGWKPTPGYTWTPGDKVAVRSQTAGVDGLMTIAAVSLTESSDEGQLAQLTLARPDAYAPLPVPERSWKG